MWKRLFEIYEESRLNEGKPECLFAETLIFNEGWLLRSVLREWRTSSMSSELSFLPFPSDAKVYSEGQLHTPFKARWSGDPKAESHTRVDGVAGHFSIADGTRSGIELSPDCRYIAVFEAKLYSPIGKGVKNASDYDQVSRTAACLIHSLLQAKPRERFEAHIVVLHPEDNRDINHKEFAKVQIRKRIRKRLEEYKQAGDPTLENPQFEAGWEEMLTQLDVCFKTWEEVLTEIGDEGLDRFYHLCRQFSK
jgi:hypothetical protein